MHEEDYLRSGLNMEGQHEGDEGERIIGSKLLQTDGVRQGIITFGHDQGSMSVAYD